MNILKSLQWIPVLTLITTNLFAQTGESCEDAIAASLGDNTTTVTHNNLTYYTYTTVQDGKLEISSCGKTTLDTHLYIFSSCGVQQNNNNDFCGTQSKMTFDVKQGTTFLFAWRVYDAPQPFEWTVSEQAWQPGELCGLATPAIEGTNTTTHTFPGNMWYTYTTTQAGKLTINGINQGNSEANWAFFRTTCGGNNLANSINYQGAQVHKSIPCAAAETFLIYWVYNDQTEPYSWTLTESPLQSGDLCMNAEEAQVGENTLANGAEDYKWFKYTATRNGKLEVSSEANSSGSSSLLWATNCSDLPTRDGIVDVNEHKNLVVNATLGTTYYFSWKTSLSGFKFTLNETDWLDGEDCSTAVLLSGADFIPGVATMPINRPHWFKFKANNDFLIQIVSCELNGSDLAEIEVFDDCNAAEPLGSTLSCGVGTKVSVAAAKDQYLYFSVTNKTSSNPSLFTLRETLADNGQACFNPIEAQLGENTVPENTSRIDQWFKYTANYSGKLILSTCHLTSNFDTRVAVYSHCGATSAPIAQNDNACGLLSELEIDCLQGVTYYFKWDAAAMAQSFTFTLTDPGVPTHVKSNTLEQAVIYPNPTSGSFQIQAQKPVAQIKIYGLDGKLILRMSHEKEAISLPAGIYVVEIELSDKNTIRQKLQVTR